MTRVRHRRHRHVIAAVLGASTCASVLALAKPARARMVLDEDFRTVQPTFELTGPALGGHANPTTNAPASLAGSTIALLDGGALAIDGDSGQLVRTDDAGKVVARLDVGRGAAQLVYDAGTRRAYVADRLGDRVVVVAVGDKLVEQAAWTTPVEPWGLALAPDGKTLLVTTIADRMLVAIDTAAGKTRWDRPLSREPRGVAIAPDGDTAMVAYLTTGTVERVDLAAAGHGGTHVSLGAEIAPSRQSGVAPAVTGFIADSTPTRSFARAAFAVRYVGNGLAVVGHQQSTPVQIAGNFRENAGSYGGGFDPPVEHRIAFVGAPEGSAQPTVEARVILHQPDALGWDPATDTLVAVGYGSDDLLVIKDASQATVALANHLSITGGCGPDGVAVADGTAWVWCSLTRRVAKVDLTGATAVVLGPEATKSKRSALEQRGLALFRGGNDGRVSSRGAMACTSCHPDGRTDGLSWRIESHELQTPLLAGRVAGTHPYKWDGGDKDLTQSLTSTMRRLGGSGLSEDEVRALSAYLESIPAPPTPRRDAKQVARGQKLFEGALGCDTCHGGKRMTDREGHDFHTNLAKVDTPSLIGVAASAPYYHDGSAATLDALLRDTATVHGMADVGDLTDAQIADLVAYLETR